MMNQAQVFTRLPQTFLFFLIMLLGTEITLWADRPNILWIVVEDASAHIGCYGETLIATPHLDQLAREGIRCDQAFVTSPVCSPSRSAMISGMYQMTLGAHNHRSQKASGKGYASEPYHNSYKVPVKLIPELFKEAGYYVTNRGKTDYNFIENGKIYDGKDWRQAKDAQPFFAQIQLVGGKRRAKSPSVKPEDVMLPPYYPDTPAVRKDWASYLESWIKTDEDVKEIVTKLKAAGRYENTAIFFWTDHGVSHLRGKQFLYEEGVHVPLIVKLPGGKQASTVRKDIIEHIDIAAASLKLAGIPIPDYVQGRDFLAANHRPRDHLFSGRDRCDETVDILRCIRDDRYKYIRNFMSYVPHAQPSQYKDGKGMIKSIRLLYRSGKLNELQARPFLTPRPVEELYDLKNDPYETVNLANDPTHLERLRGMRIKLYTRMIEVRDLGLVPEPILEELGRKAGNKYAYYKQIDSRQQIQHLIKVITAGENKDTSYLLGAAESEDPCVRYWSAVWLGANRTSEAKSVLGKLTLDTVPAVRVAAAQALFRLGDQDKLKVLAEHINDPNLLVGMYALRAIEELGEAGKKFKKEVTAAQQSQYEFSKRIARRLVGKWK